MSAEVSIERLASYTPDDAAALGELRHYESDSRPGTPLPDAMLDGIIEDPVNCVIIAARLVETGRIVSTESLNVIKSPDVGANTIGKMAWLGFVSTHPYYRKQGIFGKVWREGLGWCEEREIDSICFTSNPNNPARAAAIKIYEDNGAVKSDTNYYSVDVKAALKLST